jgi:hypothetical protein
MGKMSTVDTTFWVKKEMEDNARKKQKRPIWRCASMVWLYVFTAFVIGFIAGCKIGHDMGVERGQMDTYWRS